MKVRMLIVVISLTFLGVLSSTPTTAEQCTRSGGENGEYCRACTWSWWYFQDTCSDVTYNAHCSCTTGTEDCYGETGDCDYTGTESNCHMPGECTYHP